MKLLLIGDSHIIRFRKTLKYDIPASECVPNQDANIHNLPQWSKNINFTCGNYEHLIKVGGFSEDLYFSHHQGRHAWGSSIIFDKLNPCLKEVAKKVDIIIPAFGYIDSKIQLVKYKNPEDTAKKYVDGVLNSFPNKKIIFLEPIPQFVNNLGTGPDIYDFDERYRMHQAFVKSLRKESESNNLGLTISPEKILGIDYLDSKYECHECDYCLYPENKNVKLDHLKNKYNKIIIDEVLKLIL